MHVQKINTIITLLSNPWSHHAIHPIMITCGRAAGAVRALRLGLGWLAAGQLPWLPWLLP